MQAPLREPKESVFSWKQAGDTMSVCTMSLELTALTAYRCRGAIEVDSYGCGGILYKLWTAPAGPKKILRHGYRLFELLMR